MKSTFYYQQGYGGLTMFFIAILFGFLMYFYFYPAKFPHSTKTSQQRTCYIENPDHTRDITFRGEPYTQLRLQTAAIDIETKIHFTPVENVTDADGRSRKAYTAWLDSIRGEGKHVFSVDQPLGLGEDNTGVENLLFLDVSSTAKNRPRGTVILDYYIKTSAAIPTFIKRYCEEYPTIGSLFIWQDTYGDSFPPLSFNSNDLHITAMPTLIDCALPQYDGCLPLPDTVYKLVAWEPSIGRVNILPSGSRYNTSGFLDIPVNGENRKIPMNYVPSVQVQLVALFDLDKNIQYDYLPENIAREAPVVVDLHKKSILENPTQHMEAFLPLEIPAWGWWTPECKPAVYLYPEKEQKVNVQVRIHNGFLTYTDPAYPGKGWTVWAKPNGELAYIGSPADSNGEVNYPNGIFPYLYYEGKVADSAIAKPQKGFVKKYEQLGSFFDEVLPLLGLNEKETTEFKEYWLKALPKASYYFIGILPQAQLDQQETLTITPKEDTMIRVRLYFEALDKPQRVKAPEIQRPERNGFTVVDWGGMVKQDKAHPFTCLQ